VRHWRGELRLPLAYWINGWSTNILFLLSITLLGGSLSGHRVEPWEGAAILAAFLVIAIALYTWLYVGIVRSALRRRGFWGVIAICAVFVATIQGANALITDFGPVFTEVLRVATGRDEIPPATLTVARGGTELQIVGPIGTGSTSRFRAVIDANPAIFVVHLDSPGGRAQEAENIGREISSKGLTTYVSRQCLSACTIIFISGKQRWLATNAVLQFHSMRFSSIDGHQLQQQEQYWTREEYVRLGVPRSIAEKIASTPADKLWSPSHKELIESHLITGIADADRYERSGVLAPVDMNDHPLRKTGTTTDGFIK